MNAHARADSIIKDILVNHLPRVVDGLRRGYVDENQILVIYDHAVRARILREQADGDSTDDTKSPLPTSELQKNALEALSAAPVVAKDK